MDFLANLSPVVVMAILALPLLGAVIMYFAVLHLIIEIARWFSRH